MAFSIRSRAFSDGAEIPKQYTGLGADKSPPLAWSEPPAGTRSLALIVDDPDAPDPAAPKRVFTHWVLYNLPADTEGLEGGLDSSSLPGDAREGVNDFERVGWNGPKPPIGRHRYFFKLYALDRELPKLEHPTKRDLERAMEGHILGRAELVGTYAAQG